MTVTSKPNGARPVGTLNGSSWMGHVRAYEVDASAANIMPGDWVIMEADGKVAPAAAGSEELLGVCVGVPHWLAPKVGGISGHNVSTANVDLSKKYHATGTAGTILVSVGTETIYEMQEDGDTTPLAITDIGFNIDIIATAGSTVTGNSLQELDSDSALAATGQLRLLGLVDSPENEIGSDGTRWKVVLNESHFAKIAGI